MKKGKYSPPKIKMRYNKKGLKFFSLTAMLDSSKRKPTIRFCSECGGGGGGSLRMNRSLRLKYMRNE